LRASRPKVCILENVDEILQPRCSEDLEYLWDALQRVGYAGASKILQTKQFFLPQTRARAYFVLFDCAAMAFSVPEARERAFEVLEFTDIFHDEQLPLADFLLPIHDDSLGEELERRQRAATGDKSKSWVETHNQFLKSKGLTYTQIKADESFLENKWFQVLPSREKEVLSYALNGHPGKNDSVLCAIDVTPRIDRTIMSWDYTLPTITPTSKLWLATCSDSKKNPKNAPKRFLIGREMLGAQGFPLTWVQKTFSDPQLADIAGNSFSLPVYMAVELAVLVNIDMINMVPPPNEKDVQVSDPGVIENMIHEAGIFDD
jgi:site-specific DNA-cytosine methylase